MPYGAAQRRGKSKTAASTLESDLTVRAAEVQQQLAMACGHHWHEVNDAETVTVMTLIKTLSQPPLHTLPHSVLVTLTLFEGTSVEHTPSE